MAKKYCFTLFKLIKLEDEIYYLPLKVRNKKKEQIGQKEQFSSLLPTITLGTNTVKLFPTFLKARPPP